MKKILSVLCVLAMVASFACIGASAADATPSFALVAAPVEEGATSVTVTLQGTLPAGTEVAQAGFFVTYDEGLKLASSANVYSGAMFIGGQTTDVTPYPVLWILGTASLPAETTSDMVEFVFELPAEAKAGDTYNVELVIDAENAPMNIANDVEYAEAPVAGCTIEVVAATEATTTEATTTESSVVSSDEPDVPVSSSEAPVSSSEAPVSSSEATTTTTTATTTAPVKAPTTGEGTMFIVVALMVVALGAAVVVKKVTVK